MYKITFSKHSGKYELVRNRDGRVMGDAPGHDSIFYAMAYHMAQQQPHATGHLWRAAEEAAAGLVELHPHPAARPHLLGFALHVATVNGYQILEVHEEAEAPSAPKPKPVYTCNCPFHEKANGKRPIIAGMPVCKHILAGMMQRQLEIEPRTWEARQRKQERGRDTFGYIQREREAWEAAAEAVLATEAAQEIKATAKAKSRRMMQNLLDKNHESGIAPLVSDAELPF